MKEVSLSMWKEMGMQALKNMEQQSITFFQMEAIISETIRQECVSNFLVTIKNDYLEPWAVLEV
jgi:hypothetical protein